MPRPRKSDIIKPHITNDDKERCKEMGNSDDENSDSEDFAAIPKAIINKIVSKDTKIETGNEKYLI